MTNYKKNNRKTARQIRREKGKIARQDIIDNFISIYLPDILKRLGIRTDSFAERDYDWYFNEVTRFFKVHSVQLGDIESDDYSEPIKLALLDLAETARLYEKVVYEEIIDEYVERFRKFINDRQVAL